VKCVCGYDSGQHPHRWELTRKQSPGSSPWDQESGRVPRQEGSTASVTAGSHLQSWKVQPGRVFSKWLGMELTLLLQTPTAQGPSISVGAPRSARSNCEKASTRPTAIPCSRMTEQGLLWTHLLNFKLLPRNRHCIQLNLRVQNFPWGYNNLTHPELDFCLKGMTGTYSLCWSE